MITSASGTYSQTENNFNKQITIYKKEGIVYGIYTKDAVVDEALLRFAIARRIETCEGIPRPILIDGRDAKYWTWESRKIGFLPDANKDVKAYAFLLNSSIITTIVKWTFKMFPTPGIPRKIFTNEEEAIKWLEQYRE